MVQQEKQKEERRPLASVGEKCGVGPNLCLCVLGRRPAGPSCLFFLNPCLQETFCYKPSISRPPAGKKAHLFGISPPSLPFLISSSRIFTSGSLPFTAFRGARERTCPK